MITIGTFEIEGSFILTNRGLVIYGNIINGKVRHDDFFTFNNGSEDILLKIKSVNYLNNTTEKISKIGLIFYYDNDQQMAALQSLTLTPQIAIISNYG